MHDLCQSYLPQRKTFGKNDHNRHLKDCQRHNEKYIIEQFPTHSLMIIGTKGNVLANWKRNISNMQALQVLFCSIFSLFFFFLI